MRVVPPRALVAALLVVLFPCALAASAQAFSLDSVTVRNVASTRGPLPERADADAAGAHPDQTTTIDFRDAGDPGADSVRDVQLHLPPGMVAYVNNVATCSEADFNAGDTSTAAACPDGSRVGETTTTASTDNLLLPRLTVSGSIYNLATPPGTPPRLGIDIEVPLSPRIKLIAPVSVDPHDLGLTATLAGLPNRTVALGLVPVNLHVDQITQTLYGYVEGRPFFTNPTACVPATTTVTATSQTGATATGSASFTPTDCANEPFTASLTTTADPATADSTSAISFDVQPGQGTEARVNAHVRSTTVIAPPGVLLNPALAAGLDACTDGQFAKDDTSVAASCPASSEVGSIDFVSPILGDFPGTVYFGTQTATDRLRLFLDVPLFGAHIKVSASVNPDYTTGQVTTVFSDLPQIAFTDFRLTFRGGAKSALVTPTTCGENVSTAVVGPWSGGPDVRPQGSFTTTDCSHAFTPTLTTSVDPAQAGASPAFTLSFNRPDRTVPVGSVAFRLPPGLVGALALRGLTLCPLSAAATGACPQSSRVGSVASVVGSGGEPPTLPGSAYITEPRQAGDIAGLLVVVPAKLGPVDAGTVIVGERLVLGNDGHLDVVSEPIPALQLGIPLAIRNLTVKIDRPGFMRNPTSCGVKPVDGTFSPLDGGPDVTASSTVTVSGCDTLPFAPKITTTIPGKPIQRPALTVSVTQGADEAAIRSTVVTLPRSLSTNLDTIRNDCDPALLASGRCPPKSLIGTATAVSPLIPNPLRGPVYLVRVGTGLPKLVVQLHGQASLDLEAPITINRTTQIVTTFPAIPDLTLSRFTLAFRANGVLERAGNLCAQSAVRASFTGQNGKQASARPRLVATGCKRTATKPTARASLTFRQRRGALAASVRTPKGAKPLASVKLTLPKGLSLTHAKVTAKAAGKRIGRRALKARGRVVVVRLGKRGARSLSVRARGITAGSSKLASRLAKRRGKATLVVSTRQTSHARRTLKVKLMLR